MRRGAPSGVAGVCWPDPAGGALQLAELHTCCAVRCVVSFVCAELQLVADPEVCKRLTYRMINRSMPPQLRLDERADVINTMGLAAAR